MLNNLFSNESTKEFEMTADLSEACQSSTEAATVASKVSTLEKENCKELQQLQTLKRMCNKIQEKEKNPSCYEISEKSGVFEAACKKVTLKSTLALIQENYMVFSSTLPCKITNLICSLILEMKPLL